MSAFDPKRTILLVGWDSVMKFENTGVVGKGVLTPLSDRGVQARIVRAMGMANRRRCTLRIWRWANVRVLRVGTRGFSISSDL
jgi:hypothetical protein